MQTEAPILVLAATGKTGRRVADRLEALGRTVRRASRSSAVPFDWDEPATWGPALAGAEAAYVVYTPDLAVPGAAEALTELTTLAKAHGLRRLVLLSGRGEEEAQRCERIVAASGLEWTVVRSSWFAQNFDEGAFAPLVLAGHVALPVDAVREPFVDLEDVADVATAALVEDGHDGEVYEVTGPRSLTFAEAVGELAAASGRDVAFETITNEAFQAGLAEAGVPEDYTWLLDYLFTTVLDGRNEAVADGVERALGRAPRDFRGYARDAAARGAWQATVART